jgi:hypothetical protein
MISPPLVSNWLRDFADFDERAGPRPLLGRFRRLCDTFSRDYSLHARKEIG